MREKMERFASFSFSVGCISDSSVDVAESPQLKKSQSESSLAPPSSKTQSNNGRMRSSSLLLPKANISAGIQKVIRGFKGLFQFYREDDDDDREMEMEIGFPTDVQHVAHMGWDGFSSGGSTTVMKSWNKGPELISLPTISMKQFELAMAAQTNGPHC